MSARLPRRTLMMMVVAVATVAVAMPAAADARKPVVHELTTFAAPGCVGGCGSGSTIGPDKALYVTDGPGGRVLRIDRTTGTTTTYASGLPPAIPDVGIGGAIDVAFVGDTAYVLVTLVGPAFGQPEVVNGIYRIEKDGSATVIADLGAWSIAHPPATDFFVPSGVQYAMQKFRGGLLVTDGHHNRVLRVSRHGAIRELAAFGNVVPTGLDVHGRTIVMGEAGPIPHLPENGKVTRFTSRSPATEVASGASLIVDVELGRRQELYALSQGVWDLPPTPENEGKPAAPDTGRLLRVKRDGNFASVVEGLDRPTSLEFIGDTGFVVTLTGKVLRIDRVSRPHGRSPF
jgi:sugar lactone lactonase YvrE